MFGLINEIVPEEALVKSIISAPLVSMIVLLIFIGICFTGWAIDEVTK